MGNLAATSPPDRYDAGWFKRMWERIRLAVNTMEENNFSNALIGDTLVAQRTLSLDRLRQGEIHLPLLMLATATTTTSLTPVPVGPYLMFDPLRWPTDKTRFYFDITGGPSAVGTATFELWDDTIALASIAISTVGMSWNRAQLTSLPTATKYLVVKMKTSDAAVTAQLLGAKLVLVP